jgi:hypothetical protein
MSVFTNPSSGSIDHARAYVAGHDLLHLRQLDRVKRTVAMA